jgi:sucrose-6-phosphate hydrolase SacC (GH32 family)
MDPSCRMNVRAQASCHTYACAVLTRELAVFQDPNGPVYDAKHGIFHLFFQDHLAMPSFNGSGAGPVYGHAASKDLAHWARLPVAIWNDHRYDSVAIYTG